MTMPKMKKSIVKRFKFLNIDKIVLYKNPNECNKLKLERINPNHVGLIWGKRKKDLNKGNNHIKIGKIFFHSMPVIIGSTTLAYIDALFNYAYNLILQLGIFTLLVVSVTAIFYYGFCFKVMSKQCLTT